MKSFLNALLFVSLLSGCTPVFNFSVPEITPAKHRINVDVNYMTLFYPIPETYGVTTQEEVDKLPKEAVAKLANEFPPLLLQWGAALRDAVKRLELFKRPSKQKVTLSLKVLEFEEPTIGFSKKTRVLAEYQLTDKATNAVIYSDTVQSEVIVPFSYAFSGAARCIESITQAVRKNISIFIENLRNSPLANPSQHVVGKIPLQSPPQISYTPIVWLGLQPKR